MSDAATDFEVTIEKGTGLLWMWLVSRGGQSQAWGLSSSESEARSDAAEAVEHHRQLDADEHVMGTILG